MAEAGDLVPSPLALVQAEAIRELLVAGEMDPPALVPTAGGGIQLEWHRTGIDLEISIDEHGKTDLWVTGPAPETLAKMALLLRLSISAEQAIEIQSDPCSICGEPVVWSAGPLLGTAPRWNHTGRSAGPPHQARVASDASPSGGERG